MLDSPGIGARCRSVVAACLGSVPRRLLVLGGFAVLCWLGLTLAAASRADAAPAGSTPPAPVSGVTSLVGTATDQLTQVTAPVRSTLDQLTAPVRPATTALHRSLHQALAPVAREVSAPASDQVAELTRPISTATSGLLPALAHSTDELSHAGSMPTLLPTLGELLGAPATPTPVTVPAGAHPVSVEMAHVAATAQPGVDVHPATTQSRPADESLPATSGPASASHGPLAGLGVPAPPPDLPPVGPDSVPMAGSGSAVSGSSGPGGSSAPGCRDDGGYHPELRPLGTAGSAHTRPVRNSADEPPVSPD